MSKSHSTETVFCKGCDTLCRIPFWLMDELGGNYYCENCRSDAPATHPQNPDNDITL